jgi:rhodanese-related sulfurtransferase
MKSILVLLIVSISIVSCAQSKSSGNTPTDTEVKSLEGKTQRVSKEEFKAYMESTKVQLVDVRTPEEFSAGNINGAVNIDFYSEAFKSKLETLDKSQPVLVYCKSGGRSSQALEVMKSMGFKTVLELEGGYSNW